MATKVTTATKIAPRFPTRSFGAQKRIRLPLMYYDLNQNWRVSKILVKFSNTFHENLFSCIRLTYGHVKTVGVILAARLFCKPFVLTEIAHKY
jgi:hypothetical protein